MPEEYVSCEMRNNIEFWAIFNGDYRKNTKIIINKGYNVLGSILMLNPGSANCIGEEDSKGYQLCELDKTMKEIKFIFYEFSKHNKGIVKIVNLSDLRQPNMEKFFKDPHFKTLIQIENELEDSSWVWVAWTCKDNKELRGLQAHLLGYIQDNKPFFGKKGKLKNGYYHPGVRLKSQKLELEEEIKKELKKLTLTS